MIYKVIEYQKLILIEKCTKGTKMQDDNTIKNQIKQVIKDADDSAMVILFGSRARGTASKDSDWDVLILLKKAAISLKDEQVFRHKLYDLELQTGQPISTFVYSLHEWNTRLSGTPLYKNVQREGMVL